MASYSDGMGPILGVVVNRGRRMGRTNPCGFHTKPCVPSRWDIHTFSNRANPSSLSNIES